MKARDVVGRTIVGVRQRRTWDEATRRFTYAVESIQLDNGRSILLSAQQDYTGDWVTAEVVGP